MKIFCVGATLLRFDVRSTKRDYKTVLRAIINILTQPVALKEVVSDFEVPFWRAVRSVLPEVTHKGHVLVYIFVQLFIILYTSFCNA